MGIGTSFFISNASAVRYYMVEENSSYEQAKLSVTRKLQEGLIHIGKPDLKPGQRLVYLDRGNRYGIEE